MPLVSPKGGMEEEARLAKRWLLVQGRKVISSPSFFYVGQGGVEKIPQANNVRVRFCLELGLRNCFGRRRKEGRKSRVLFRIWS